MLFTRKEIDDAITDLMELFRTPLPVRRIREERLTRATMLLERMREQTRVKIGERFAYVVSVSEDSLQVEVEFEDGGGRETLEIARVAR